MVGCTDAPSELTPDANEGAIDPMDGPIENAWIVDELHDPTIKLNAIWGSSANDIYAVGRKGTACAIVHSAGNGEWVEQTAGVNGELFTVWGSGPNDIYVGGYGDILLHSTGDGVWTKQTIPVRGVMQIGGTGPDDVYVADMSATLYRSTGDGTWTPLTLGNSQSGIHTLWGTSATTVRFAGGISRSPHVVRGPTNPMQETMPAMPDTNPRAIHNIWGGDAGDLYAVGDHLTILHSDGGGTWTLQAGPTGNATFLDVWGSGRDDVYIVSDQAGVFHSPGDGTWSQVPYLRSEPRGVWGSSRNDVYVVGNTIAHLKQ